MVVLLLLVILVSLNLPRIHCEYYFRRIAPTSSKQFNLFRAFMKTTKEIFFQEFTRTINALRRKDGIPGSITVDDKFCQFLRSVLISIANDYPESNPREHQSVYLLYGNISGPTDSRTGDLALESDTSLVCCDKAIRSSRDIFVICGFSGGEFTRISKSELDENIDELLTEASDILPEETNEYSGIEDNTVDGKYGAGPLKGKNLKAGPQHPLEFGPVITL
ncbi:unnamed protein product [Allacma fusca]|uniref:Uncharacterized protein n=1 Tax=Allacma fusca TaxID=39272 RepID=A0A8J2K6W3_9HEXA|nr:unnamed protein product [Allacma fusca]